MTLHYHGTPITPVTVLRTLGGCHFCVSHADPRDCEEAHRIGQSVMLDNGAYSIWQQGGRLRLRKLFDWVSIWIGCPTTWAVVPDTITGTIETNRYYISQWPFPKNKSAAVWHLHEPLDWLIELIEQDWFITCFGSSAQYSVVGSDIWRARVAEAFDHIILKCGALPRIHMLRGMRCAWYDFPFYSVDSTDIARHHTRKNNAPAMAKRWDARQCPISWQPQRSLFDA